MSSRREGCCTPTAYHHHSVWRKENQIISITSRGLRFPSHLHIQEVIDEGGSHESEYRQPHGRDEDIILVNSVNQQFKIDDND